MAMRKKKANIKEEVLMMYVLIVVKKESKIVTKEKIKEIREGCKER